jgi:hypothetical protein
MTITHHRTSSGTSLANALYESLDDFWRAFGRPPSLILIPRFRVPEIEEWMVAYWVNPMENKFAGIPFKFTDGDVIEMI